MVIIKKLIIMLALLWVPQFVTAGSSNCQPGKYFKGILCVPADLGYKVPNAGATKQTSCPRGTYTSELGQSACKVVNRGYYAKNNAEVRATGQTPCSSGDYNLSEGNTSCLRAEPGYYAPGEPAIETIKCPTGTFSSGFGSSSCTRASKGYYVSGIGKTSQTKTSKNYYTATDGASSQTACPHTKITAGTGSTSANDCKPESPGAYYNYNGKGASGTKAKSPHKCKSGKNWKWSAQACK